MIPVVGGVYIVRSQQSTEEAQEDEYPCECESDLLGYLGSAAELYALHMDPLRRFAARGVAELQCPTAGTRWMLTRNVDAIPIVLRLPEEAEQPRIEPSELPGLYL
jgi:hypothetical protein